MSDLKPVGEFGSVEWCEACGKAGAKMLQDANLPADTAWGFTENYLYPPERMLEGGREISAFYFMVKDGVCSGGDGAPEDCLALDGFHIKAGWGSICSQSRAIYDSSKQRGADEAPFFEALLHDALSDKPHVSDVRNYGFAGAITLDPYPDEPLRRPFEVAMKMWEKGFLVRYGGDTIQLAPMFVMERPEMESLVGALADSLQELA